MMVTSNSYRSSSSSCPYELHHSVDTSTGVTATMDVQLLAQTLVYYSTLIFGLLVSVPVAMTTRNFGGNCVLYAELTDEQIEFGSAINCHLVTYTHIACSVIWAGGLAVCYTYAVMCSARGKDFQFVLSQCFNISVLCVNIVVSCLSLVSACLLSVGFSVWCGNILSNRQYILPLHSCSEAEQLDWQNVNGTTFHSCFSLATAACWLCVFSWLVQTGLNVVVFVQHKHELLFQSSPPSSAPSTPIHMSLSVDSLAEKY